MPALQTKLPPPGTAGGGAARFLIELICFGLLLASTLMGIFAAMGFCAMIFGSRILDTTLSANPIPDRTHPASITFALLFPLGMIIGGIGAIFGFILPLKAKLGIPLGPRNESMRRWLHCYARHLAAYTAPPAERPGTPAEEP